MVVEVSAAVCSALGASQRRVCAGLDDSSRLAFSPLKCALNCISWRSGGGATVGV